MLIDKLGRKLSDYSDKFTNTLKRYDVKQASENLRIFFDTANSHKFKCWLMFGTLLGYVRDNRLIEHDCDIDIGCLHSELDYFIPVLLDLEKSGFELIRANEQDMLFSFIYKGVYIDLYAFKNKSDNQLACYGYRMDEKDTIDLQVVDFVGTKVAVPSNPTKLLEKWYGTDWKTPIQGRPAKQG